MKMDAVDCQVLCTPRAVSSCLISRMSRYESKMCVYPALSSHLGGVFVYKGQPGLKSLQRFMIVFCPTES